MGERGRWFSLVKKALSCESKEKKNKKSRKSRRWFGNQRRSDLNSSVHSPMENVKLMEAENAQNRHAYSVAFATAVAADAQAAAEVVRLTAAPLTLGKTKEEKACIKVQTSFRGYLARKTLRSVRGLARLKSLIEGHSVKRQVASTLQCMQMMARIQFEICERRIRTSEDNKAIQRQIQRKYEREIEKLRASVTIGEDWDNSMQSKEQIEAKFQSRQGAEIRRERALAYAYSHQQTQRSSFNSVNRTFMDPNNPHWGWSWLAQWIAARHWENGNAVDKGLNSDRVLVKSSTEANNKPSPMAQKQSRTPGRGSPSTPISKTAKKVRSPSSRGTIGTYNDSKSMNSIQSEQCQRHSIAGSSVKDNESFASSPAAPRYMATTESAKAKSRQKSPIGLEKIRTPEKELVGSAKERPSFFCTPACPRSHSDPQKIDNNSRKDIGINSLQKATAEGVYN